MLAEHLQALKASLQSIAEEKLSGVDLKPTINIDAQIAFSEIPGANFHFLQSLAPFGQGNPAPVFLTRGVQVVEAATMGRRK